MKHSVYIVLIITIISCSSSDKIYHKSWVSVKTEGYSRPEILYNEYFCEKAWGDFYWQIRFIKGTLIQNKSNLYNILYQDTINYSLKEDTLTLSCLGSYQYNKTGSGIKFFSEEKWLISYIDDTLLLTGISIKNRYGMFKPNVQVYFVEEKFDNVNPMMMDIAPSTKAELMCLLDSRISDDGKELIKLSSLVGDYEQITHLFNTIRQYVVDAFDIERSIIIQNLYQHHHPDVIAMKIIQDYKKYLQKESANR